MDDRIKKRILKNVGYEAADITQVDSKFIVIKALKLMTEDDMVAVLNCISSILEQKWA